MLALMAAMKAEIEPFKKHMDIHKHFQKDDCLIFEGKYRGQPALLVQTGVGGHRAEEAVKHVISQYPVTGILSLGFAGGLVPGLKAGDLVICTRLVHGKSPVMQSSASLLGLFKPASGVVEGCLVTVSRPASQQQQKEELAQKYNAHAVDMESYWIAAEAARQNVPCLVVRAISDPVGKDLPDLEEVSNGTGTWNKRRAVFYFISHPVETVRLIFLYFGHRRSKKNMIDFVDAFVPAYKDQKVKLGVEA